MMLTPCEYVDYLSSLHVGWETKRYRGNVENLLALPGAFDTEFTSSYATVAGERVKIAFMYAWMFGIGEPDSPVCLGRTWDEWVWLVDQLHKIFRLNQNNRLVIYVHNLSAEFQYMYRWFTWGDVFNLESHRPVYAKTNGIEFRCSQKLSGGRSLFNIGENLVDQRFKKLKGDLDYRLIRHSQTPLTQKEQGYCENDIRVLLAYIKEKVQDDGSLWNIPLTNTGYVRRHIRDETLSSPSYKSLIKKLTLTPEIYSLCHAAFRGGDTHANAKFVEAFDSAGRRIKRPHLNRDGSIDNVYSYDLSSSYPAVMVLEEYPMSAPTIHPDIHELSELRQAIKGKRAVFNLTLEDVSPAKDFHHLIPAARCSLKVNTTEDNGRIVTADLITLPITDVELDFILRFYSAANISVSSLVTWESAPLPKQLVKCILDSYSNKTLLKGIAGQERNYMIAKIMTNSSFGMMVTNIVRAIFRFDNELGFLPKEHPDLVDEINKYNKKFKRFLYYPWGVFITAYARRNLWTAIEELEDDFVYCDTDSVKFINAESHKAYFEKYNEDVVRKCKRASLKHKLPLSLFSPQSKTGEYYTIGLWDYEGMYVRFKTLGAKRYLVQYPEEKLSKLRKDFPKLKGPYLMTCAGLNKEMGTNYLIDSGNPFDAFQMGLSIPSEQSGRLVHTYLDYGFEGNITDYLGNVAHVVEKSGLHLEPASYELHTMDKFARYLRTTALGAENLLAD